MQLQWHQIKVSIINCPLPFEFSLMLSQRTAFHFIICLLFAAGFSVSVRAQRPDKPAVPRRNIGLFFDKMRAGRAVTVAYLGGSITAGAGATDIERTSWRAQITNWLRQQFPGSSVTEINAAVGGTGSAYGAMRLRRDVIAHKPDLVFVEFAINDWNEPERAVRESIEGITRQLLIQPQPPEIVFLYTTRLNRNTRADWHEAMAEHYRLPSINVGPPLWKYIEQEEIKPESLWKDGVHPNDEGHKRFAQVILAFLEEQKRQKASPQFRNLPFPLEQEMLTYGEIRSFVEFKFGPAWKAENSSDSTLPAKLLASDKAGSELEIVFEGSAVGLAYRMGPDCGIIECLIDGKPAPAPLARIDTWNSFHHIQTRILTSGLDSGPHKLTIRIAKEKNPGSTGHHIRLGVLLSGGQRPEKLQ
jgi:sialidase-1